MWPFFDAVGKRCNQLYTDFKHGQDITKYTTTGQEERRIEVKKTKRHESPSKGATSGSNAANWKQNSSPNLHNDGSAPLRGGAAASSKSSPDVLCGSHLKTAEDLTGYPTFPAGTKSSLMRNLTRDLWAKYADVKDKYGFSFK